uniref:MCM_OB domain-containing protein n=1 Tax=Panagrellus redivivus TaxID=6233 RepID=A0A7E4USG1_PANRE
MLLLTNLQPAFTHNQSVPENIEPVVAKGVCVTIVGTFKSATETHTTRGSNSVDFGNGLRALETSDSKMHRQYTSSSAGDEEFSAEELEEFATAFKVGLMV